MDSVFGEVEGIIFYLRIKKLLAKYNVIASKNLRGKMYWLFFYMDGTHINAWILLEKLKGLYSI